MKKMESPSSLLGEIKYSPVFCFDLGSLLCRGGFHAQNEIKLLDFGGDNHLMDSIVAFTPDGRKIGNAARDYMHGDSSNVVSEIKHLMGRNVDDVVKSQDKRLPYTIRKLDGKPIVCVQEGNVRKVFKPREITALLLGEMKKTAERQLRCPVYDCIITVPTHFDTAMREDTIKAAKLAKLNVIQVLNESVAAAIHLSTFFGDFSRKRTVLVADIGGSTTDLCVVNITKERNGTLKFDVASGFGSYFVGGADMTGNIVRIIQDQCENLGRQVTDDNKDAINKMRKKAEQVKIDLNERDQVEVTIQALLPGFDFAGVITQAEFDNSNAAIYDKIIKSIETTLGGIENVKNRRITDVLMTGGASAVPGVQTRLRTFFPRSNIWDLNRQEDVIRGACVFAAHKDGIDKYSNIILNDCLPFNVGIESVGGGMITLIKRNAMFPIQSFSTIRVPYEGATDYTVTIREGNAAQARLNEIVGTVSVKNLKPGLDKHARVEIFVKGDSYTGKLQVSAKDANGFDSADSTETNPTNMKLHALHFTENLDKRRVKNAMMYFSTKEVYIKKFLESRAHCQRFLFKCEQQLLQIRNNCPDFVAKRKVCLLLASETRRILYGHMCPYTTPKDFETNTLEFAGLFREAMQAAGLTADSRYISDMHYSELSCNISDTCFGKVLEMGEDNCGSKISHIQDQVEFQRDTNCLGETILTRNESEEANNSSGDETDVYEGHHEEMEIVID